MLYSPLILNNEKNQTHRYKKRKEASNGDLLTHLNRCKNGKGASNGDLLTHLIDIRGLKEHQMVIYILTHLVDAALHAER